MTKEEKVKAYDEAIKRAKKELNTCGSQDCDAARQIFRFFPELKESEDERIRKEMFDFFNQLEDKKLRGVDISSWIAWLEKQGEQKPTDNVEPKFKIEKGKWYVCIKYLLDNYANKAFCKGDTYLSTQDGSLIPSNSNVPFKITCPDTYFRDWTILDAKDGDVLATKVGGIFIYKELLYNKPFAYCGVDKFGVFKDCNCGDGRDWTPYLSDVTPATKEQRDTLERAMTNAGYRWDKEKLKLEKI